MGSVAKSYMRKGFLKYELTFFRDMITLIKKKENFPHI